MKCKAWSIGLKATLAILTLALFATGTCAVAQDETLLYSFESHLKDGKTPIAGLIFDGSGNLYGTTSTGGADNGGTVFELTPTSGGGWTETLLHTFKNETGAQLRGGLIFDASGNLYGATFYGGPSDSGSVFELTPKSGGGWKNAVLHTFNGKDGANPAAALIFDTAGNLYGTTASGGAHNDGTVFELMPKSGGGWKEKVLHNFNTNGKDGSLPFAGLIFDAAGNLYGATTQGGNLTECGGFGCGIVFELTPSTGGGWREKILHTFSGPDGNEPFASLIFDTAGNLYGTTASGGAHNDGTVFELMPKSGGGWKEKVLHNFNQGAAGNNPRSSLIFDAAGNLYGTTVSPYGTAFELMPEVRGPWTLKALHIFTFNGTDGVDPYAGLIFDAAGKLYGTTSGGGAHDSGTVFEITP
jgi:uncharacterized repeat protein (TIGR03803 family)